MDDFLTEDDPFAWEDALGIENKRDVKTKSRDLIE